MKIQETNPVATERFVYNPLAIPGSGDKDDNIIMLPTEEGRVFFSLDREAARGLWQELGYLLQTRDHDNDSIVRAERAGALSRYEEHKEGR